MKTLVQDNSHTKAYICRNMFITEDGTVIAVQLGHCVYGKNGHLKAKLLGNELYDLRGYKLGHVSDKEGNYEINYKASMSQTWDLLNKVKDYTDPHITPSSAVSQRGLVEYFLEDLN